MVINFVRKIPRRPPPGLSLSPASFSTARSAFPVRLCPLSCTRAAGLRRDLCCRPAGSMERRGPDQAGPGQVSDIWIDPNPMKNISLSAIPGAVWRATFVGKKSGFDYSQISKKELYLQFLCNRKIYQFIRDQLKLVDNLQK